MSGVIETVLVYPGPQDVQHGCGKASGARASGTYFQVSRAPWGDIQHGCGEFSIHVTIRAQGGSNMRLARARLARVFICPGPLGGYPALVRRSLHTYFFGCFCPVLFRQAVALICQAGGGFCQAVSGGSAYAHVDLMQSCLPQQ